MNSRICRSRQLPQVCVEVKVPVPWGTIAGRWYGDRTKRPILALHGWLDNCGTFINLAPLLTKYASILCVDLPGHGLSSHLPPGTMYFNLEYVRAILRLMLAYHWSKVSLLGHSMGASVAFHFAAFYPDRVDCIIAIDLIKFVYFDPAYAPDFYRYAVERVLANTDRLKQDDDKNEPPAYTYKECETLVHEGSFKSVNVENAKHLLERNISKSKNSPNKYFFSRDSRIKQMIELNPDEGLSAEMARRICVLKIPYLVIKGGSTNNPTVQNDELVDYMIKNNPNFQLHVVPDTTHHVHLNNADKVADLIIPFLKTYRTPQHEIEIFNAAEKRRKLRQLQQLQQQHHQEIQQQQQQKHHQERQQQQQQQKHHQERQQQQQHQGKQTQSAHSKL